MMAMRRWFRSLEWPLVSRRTYGDLQRENFELRGAIRSANEELQRHRKLIAGLQSGQPDIIRAFEKAIAHD